MINYSLQSYQRWTKAILMCLLVGILVGIVVPAGLGWDFANFYDTGRRVAAGQASDIYFPGRPIAGTEPQGGLAFWGTPLSAWLYAPLSCCRAETALLLFKLQNSLAYILALGGLFLLNRAFIVNDAWSWWRYAAFFCGLCLFFQPLWTIYRVGGQTTPTVLLLLTIGLFAHIKANYLLSAICVVTAVMIKPAFSTGLAFLMVVSGWNFMITSLVVLTIMGLLSLGIMGWELHLEFLSRMLQGSKITYPWIYNSSLYVVVEHLRLFNGTHSLSLPKEIFSIGFFIIKFGVVGMFVRLFMRFYRTTQTAQARNHFVFVMAFTFSLFISQTVWEHYLSVLMLLFAHIAAMVPELDSSGKKLVLGVVALTVGQNLIFIHVLQGVFSFDGILSILLACLFKSAPLIGTAIFLWKYDSQIFESYQRARWGCEMSFAPFKWRSGDLGVEGQKIS